MFFKTATAFLISELTLAYGALKASSALHFEILHRIIRAPSWFFDTTPTGRIVNRFAKDLDVCDVTLRERMMDLLECFFKVITGKII